MPGMGPLLKKTSTRLAKYYFSFLSWCSYMYCFAPFLFHFVQSGSSLGSLLTIFVCTAPTYLAAPFRQLCKKISSGIWGNTKAFCRDLILFVFLKLFLYFQYESNKRSDTNSNNMSSNMATMARLPLIRSLADIGRNHSSAKSAVNLGIMTFFILPRCVSISNISTRAVVVVMMRMICPSGIASVEKSNLSWGSLT